MNKKRVSLKFNSAGMGIKGNGHNLVFSLESRLAIGEGLQGPMDIE